MAQLINLTSEALQATIRRLLPSQQGFGEDLQATNVVTPIIDLTPTAEGSVLPGNLQQALALGSSTAHNVNNELDEIITTPGFYRITGSVVCDQVSGNTGFVIFSTTDGFSSTVLFEFFIPAGAEGNIYQQFVDLVVFVDSGNKVTINASSGCRFIGSSRQIADKSGNLVNPVGFTAE